MASICGAAADNEPSSMHVAVYDLKLTLQIWLNGVLATRA